MSRATSRKSPATLREQIALAVAEANRCHYCLAAHSLLGGKAGLAARDVLAARRGDASDPHPEFLKYAGDQGMLVGVDAMRWTDTEIDVVVPPWAASGELQLNVVRYYQDRCSLVGSGWRRRDERDSTRSLV